MNSLYNFFFFFFTITNIFNIHVYGRNKHMLQTNYLTSLLAQRAMTYCLGVIYKFLLYVLFTCAHTYQ